jgi:hypothetical protein
MTEVNVREGRACALSQDRIVEKPQKPPSNRRDNSAELLSRSRQGDQVRRGEFQVSCVEWKEQRKT